MESWGFRHSAGSGFNGFGDATRALVVLDFVKEKQITVS